MCPRNVLCRGRLQRLAQARPKLYEWVSTFSLTLVIPESEPLTYGPYRRDSRTPLISMRYCCSHAESERAKKESRLGFLKFHRRNSSASARSTSIAPSIGESDAGTEPPASQCGTPVPADQEQEHEQSVSTSRQLCALAATIMLLAATGHKQVWLLRTGDDG